MNTIQLDSETLADWGRVWQEPIDLHFSSSKLLKKIADSDNTGSRTLLSH